MEKTETGIIVKIIGKRRWYRFYINEINSMYYSMFIMGYNNDLFTWEYFKFSETDRHKNDHCEKPSKIKSNYIQTDFLEEL
jgi:hypothetical protein